MGAASTARTLRAVLAGTRNTDGGWGYMPRRTSRLEPTALALLALTAAGERARPDVLSAWPTAGGLLVDPASREVNITHNGEAALVAQALGLDDLAVRIVAALVRLKGMRLPPSQTNKQDNSLQGWPWVAETFSWVEPTAWCLLAVKRWAKAHPGPDAAARIEEADRLLLDRSCREGGWNYGNSIVLGQKLAPYVPTTAVALLALQTRRSHEVVARSFRYLEAHRLDERSGLALALARIALGVYGGSVSGIERAIDAAWAESGFLDNLMVSALVLYALAAGDSYAAFTL